MDNKLIYIYTYITHISYPILIFITQHAILLFTTDLNGFKWLYLIFINFLDRGRDHIETSPLVYSENQWTVFFITGASAMKGLIFHCQVTFNHIMCVENKMWTASIKTVNNDLNFEQHKVSIKKFWWIYRRKWLPFL